MQKLLVNHFHLALRNIQKKMSMIRKLNGDTIHVKILFLKILRCQNPIFRTVLRIWVFDFPIHSNLKMKVNTFILHMPFRIHTHSFQKILKRQNLNYFQNKQKFKNPWRILKEPKIFNKSVLFLNWSIKKIIWIKTKIIKIN